MSNSMKASTNPFNSAWRWDVCIADMPSKKTFHGELDATSRGEMLAAMTAVKGSAGYVAIEQVSGSLSGKQGGFVPQHCGTMAKGQVQLTATVFPDTALWTQACFDDENMAWETALASLDR